MEHGVLQGTRAPVNTGVRLSVAVPLHNEEAGVGELLARLGAGGVTLWNMVYFKGRARR